MKRFHVHIVVDNLANSIDFYSKLFGQLPDKQRDDYAKWMLEDPRLNFAISAQGAATGVNHFGFQVDSSEELRDIRQLAENAASGNVLDQGEASCCYARGARSTGPSIPRGWHGRIFIPWPMRRYSAATPSIRRVHVASRCATRNR